MTQKRLVIDSARCDGCGICQLACAVLRQGQWNPALGRIRMISDPVWGGCLAFTCAHCQDPPCALSCLMNVIYKEKNGGVTLRRMEGCIGCRVCEMACPFGAAVYDEINGKVITCDLCAGSPACIEYCPRGALIFIDPREESERLREEAAARLGKVGSDLIDLNNSSAQEERPCE